ncbi:HAMP domain-containing protein (plasmid) [Agrobacterium tumefaciens]|uniref:HAMP domain-containing protein n=2 Tax=Agrobacterium tumefaciens TaxID=358 RepID=A0AAJ4N972_AGRTU|nr:HAMP domain-containing protein [Agrobacterium tumefaciens]
MRHLRLVQKSTALAKVFLSAGRAFTSLDNMLSRYRIRTKVLLFVLPFVISISAVGFTGLYVSGLLQGRMEISNGILQSLTGFKNLYASMDDFLRSPTEAAKNKLLADIGSQKDILAATLSQTGPSSEGHDDLAAAARKTLGVSAIVDKLWSLHQQEVDLRGAVKTEQSALIGARFNVSSVSQQLQDSTGDSTTEASATLPVLENTRRLEGSIYSMQLVLAEFISATDKANLVRLRQEFAKLGTNIDTLEQSPKGRELAGDIVTPIRPMIESMEANGAILVDTIEQKVAAYADARQQFDQIWSQLTSFSQFQKQRANAERQQANSITVLATSLGVALSIVGGIALVLTLQRPISQVTAAMRRIADGALDTSILGEKRSDEIGEMARALGIFKENAISKIRMEELTDGERQAADEERRRNDAEKLEMDRQIEFAVNALAAGLERMSQGDISTTIETPFIGRLEQLRQDFNGSMMRLQATMSQIRDNVELIQGNGNQMAQSAEDLSKRTEQQAVSLEETAAAVDEITATVRSSAERAKDADQIVRQAKRSADDSAVVVRNATDAMSRIEDASRQIEQIIGVIDEIAFQTNLLALNAGIEAARAGDAGKGFAVVAHEVRELAQRSAAAAQEIKGLINKSTNEVNSGSQFVQETGTVLSKISTQIVTISQHVEMIARASHDQSNALQSVNATVNQMDQMTQENAAMVEETTAASRELAVEADALMKLIHQFKIEAKTRFSGHRAA